MNYELILKTLRQLVPQIKNDFGVRSMSVFGSVARGEAKNGSDIDICVDMAPKAYNVVALKLWLQSKLGIPVDLVRQRSTLDPFLQMQIKKDGIAIIP